MLLEKNALILNRLFGTLFYKYETVADLYKIIYL